MLEIISCHLLCSDVNLSRQNQVCWKCNFTFYYLFESTLASFSLGNGKSKSSHSSDPFPEVTLSSRGLWRALTTPWSRTPLGPWYLLSCASTDRILGLRLFFFFFPDHCCAMPWLLANRLLRAHSKFVLFLHYPSASRNCKLISSPLF